jgi:hypothetical protein
VQVVCDLKRQIKTCLWRENIMKNKVYAQLYSFLRTNQKDLVASLEAMSKIGYDGVELMGTYMAGMSVAEYKAFLKDLKLDPISSHGLNGEKDYEIAQELGIRHTDIRANIQDYTKDGVLKACEEMNKEGELRAKYGMKAVLHNHSQEFRWIKGEEGKTKQKRTAAHHPEIQTHSHFPFQNSIHGIKYCHLQIHPLNIYHVVFVDEYKKLFQVQNHTFARQPSHIPAPQNCIITPNNHVYATDIHEISGFCSSLKNSWYSPFPNTAIITSNRYFVHFFNNLFYGITLFHPL